MTAAGLGYTAALLLAVVMLVAAVAKLREPKLTVRSFVDLGVPRAELAATVVPVVEVAIAGSLVIMPATGGLAALVTLAFFTTFLVGRLRAGVRAPCACFGATARAPLSIANVIGNGFLLVLAGLALLTPDPVVPTLVDVVAVGLGVAAEVALLRVVRARLGPNR